jgi:hypothetical protein
MKLSHALISIALLGGATATAAQMTIAQTTPALQPQYISPNAYKVPYLGLDATFIIDATLPESMNDPRNTPKQIVMEKMETFSYYSDLEGKEAIAEGCPYVYMGAAPDPEYYAEYRSVWDMFELAAEEDVPAACNQFKYLIVTAPHGEPPHMHLRHGDASSSFTALMNMSSDPEDEATFNPWWPTYCTTGRTGCGD